MIIGEACVERDVGSLVHVEAGPINPLDVKLAAARMVDVQVAGRRRLWARRRFYRRSKGQHCDREKARR